MEDIAQSPPASRLNFGWRPRTGTLLFVILGVALAPIGLIGVRAALTQLERSDAERSALLAASTREQAGNLASRLRSDRNIIEQALRRRGDGPTGELCRTLLGLFPGTNGDTPMLQVVDPTSGAHLCVFGVPADRSAIGRRINGVRLSTEAASLTYSVAQLGETGLVEIVYPAPTLTAIMGQSRAIELEQRVLDSGAAALPLDPPGSEGGWGGFDLASRAPVGQTGLTLRTATTRAFFDSADAFLTLATPVGMWLLALLLSWLVVDTLLLGPVARFGRRLQGYAPGDEVPQAPIAPFRVAEIGTLDGLLQGLLARVTEDKQSLGRALDHQQSLTREVHHRVKNNLQIIASLINLHSRDSASEQAIGAYRTMQRRVDALAVVYRHLQAEGEDRIGVAANTMLTDLSNGLRQSLGADAEGGVLHVDAAPCHVSQDVALPMAFFVTELTELAFLRAPGSTVTVALAVAGADRQTARLSVTATTLRGATLFDGNHASYHRVLQGLARQLRRPLDIDERGGRYAIVVPLLAPA